MQNSKVHGACINSEFLNSEYIIYCRRQDTFMEVRLFPVAVREERKKRGSEHLQALLWLIDRVVRRWVLLHPTPYNFMGRHNHRDSEITYFNSKSQFEPVFLCQIRLGESRQQVQEEITPHIIVLPAIFPRLSLKKLITGLTWLP